MGKITETRDGLVYEWFNKDINHAEIFVQSGSKQKNNCMNCKEEIPAMVYRTYERMCPECHKYAESEC